MAENPQEPNTGPEPGDQPGATPPAGEGGEVSKDARTMALLAHLLGILLSVIGPLIIWLLKREESEFVDDQGKEALNFQITILLAYVVASILTMILIGCILIPLILIVNIVFCIIAAMKANEGIRYRYPFALRLIK